MAGNGLTGRWRRLCSGAGRADRKGIGVHELSLCQAVARAADARADGRAVSRVTIRVGHLRQVVPDAMQFAWQVLTEGTSLAGAALEIESEPAVVRCTSCGARTTLDDLPLLVCGSCAGGDVELESGEALLLVSIDVTQEVT